MNKAKSPGIYIIRHCPSGIYYVGQSNDVPGRINEHKNSLRLGLHINCKLQRLWNETHQTDFIFKIIEIPPIGLSPLELQRWLVKAERNHITAARKAGLSLNINDAEIVRTKAAWEEHVGKKIQEAKTDERRSKERDKAIRATRKVINNDIKSLEELAQCLVTERYKLNNQLAETKKELNKKNNWKSVLFGAPKNVDFVNLEKIKLNLEQRIQEIENNLSQISSKKSYFLKEKRQLHTRKEALNRLRKVLPIPLGIDESFRPRIGKITE